MPRGPVAKPKLTIVCKECQKEFQVTQRDFCRKYCSQTCYRVQYKTTGHTGIKFGLKDPREGSER